MSNIFKSEPSQTLIMLASIRRAECKSFARKNTHITVTKLNVKNQAGAAGIWPPYLDQIRCSTIATPCIPPQMTNIQLAPCQRPPRRNVRNKLKYVVSTPDLLPPSG